MKLGNIQIKKGGGGGGGGVTTFNDRSGAVTLEDTDISGAGGLLADGTEDGATSQAQVFTQGLKTNAINDNGNSIVITQNTVSKLIQLLTSNSVISVSSDGDINMSSGGSARPFTIDDGGAGGGIDFSATSGIIAFPNVTNGITVGGAVGYTGTLAQAITDGCNVTNGFITEP